MHEEIKDQQMMHRALEMALRGDDIVRSESYKAQQKEIENKVQEKYNQLWKKKLQ